MNLPKSCHIILFMIICCQMQPRSIHAEETIGKNTYLEGVISEQSRIVPAIRYSLWELAYKGYHVSPLYH